MLLIDLETQSYAVESGIYEVACLVSEGYELIDELYLGKEIDGFTGSKKYGYGFYDISQDNEYIDAFRGFLSKYPYPIVAHNCPFDKKFLVYYGWVKGLSILLFHASHSERSEFAGKLLYERFGKSLQYCR